MNDKKVYCIDCEFFYSSSVSSFEECTHPTNYSDTYKEPSKKATYFPSHINYFNNCINFKQKEKKITWKKILSFLHLK